MIVGELSVEGQKLKAIRSARRGKRGALGVFIRTSVLSPINIVDNSLFIRTYL